MCENNTWQAPLWLTDAYLEDVLKNFLKDEKVQIHNVDIKPATANGENYASVMSRIRISFKTSKEIQQQELSFIMKYSYESDALVANIMAGHDVYNTEMKMYEQILPQLVEILKECDDTQSLFAKTLKVDYDKSAIIFEDLSVKNFVMSNPIKGLDETHAKMILEKLAKYHAASAVLNERQNGALQKFDHGSFNRYENSRGITRIFENFVEEAANYAKDCPDLGPYYYDKIIKLVPHVADYAVKAYASNPNSFDTLCHGDFWMPNVMMLYDESKEKHLKDVMLIDFQLCHWSSVAVDLHYFFSSSLEAEMYADLNCQDKLIQHYHSVLSEILRKSKYCGHIPTLHELCVQIEEARFLAFLSFLTNRAILNNDQSKDVNIHCLLGNDEKAKQYRRTCFQIKRYGDLVKTMLPFFDRHGLLDLQK